MAIWRTTTTTPSAPLASRMPDPTVGDGPFFRAWTEDLSISGFLVGTERLSDILQCPRATGRPAAEHCPRRRRGPRAGAIPGGADPRDGERGSLTRIHRTPATVASMTATAGWLAPIQTLTGS